MVTLPACELENRLVQLDKLLEDLMAGRFNRTVFQPWEVELLLDIQTCLVGAQRPRELLRRYQKAAHRWRLRGGRTLLLFSDYLAKRHLRAPVRGEYSALGVVLERCG